MVYDAADGRIKRFGNAPPDHVAIQAGPGEVAIEGSGSDTGHYVVSGAIVPRPTMPTSIDKTECLADGVDVVTISGVPNPTDVRVSGPASEVMQVTDGALELTFDVPGRYRILLQAFPYLDHEYQIDAT